LVIERSGGVCESCRQARGEQVHHLKYWPGKKRGGEPLEWLLHLCFGCHQAKHPHKLKTNAELVGAAKARDAKQEKRRVKRKRGRARKRKKREKDKGWAQCRWCGGRWSYDKHQQLCVRAGVDKQKQDKAA
jgi:hypothetical protein